MATAKLKRTAAIWVPPRSVGERAFVNEPTLLAMLPAADGSAGVQVQRSSLEALPQLKSAALVFDSRDVSLLAVKLPPLSGARLAKALPNLVEDLLLQDVQSCSFAIGPKVDDDGRLIAVIDRNWLDFVVGAFERRGIKITAAWPSQLALPLEPGRWSIACLRESIAVRTGVAEGYGWSAGATPEARVESLSAAIDAGAFGGKPQGALVFTADDTWTATLSEVSGKTGLALEARPLPLPTSASVNLMDARRAGAAQRWLAAFDWRAWRLPLAMAASVLVAFLIGLNADWARMAGERSDLRRGMENTFRRTFPDAQVVVDPMLQMQRRVTEMRQGAGQSAPEDFLPMLTRFSAALGARSADSVAQIEYRDARLRVRFKQGFFDGPGARDALSTACRQKGLHVDFEGEGNAIAIVKVQS